MVRDVLFTKGSSCPVPDSTPGEQNAIVIQIPMPSQRLMIHRPIDTKTKTFHATTHVRDLLLHLLHSTLPYDPNIPLP